MNHELCELYEALDEGRSLFSRLWDRFGWWMARRKLRKIVGPAVFDSPATHVNPSNDPCEVCGL